MNVELRVFGEPAPQGSHRMVPIKGTNRYRVVPTGSARLRRWRRAIVESACDWHLYERLDGPVEVRVTFYCSRPKRPTYAWPVVDVDKLVRATLDGLTEAGLWRNDSQVVAVRAVKVYASEAVPAGAVVRVTLVDAAAVLG